MEPESNNVEQSPATLIPPFGAPSQKQQSWGTLISVIIIVMMIVVGAFYAWGKRISEQQTLSGEASTN